MKLSVGFSTCPNDTFMFEAIVNKRLDMDRTEFDFMLSDVEELNKKAKNNELDISKISIAAYPYFADQYELLTAGSAIGKGNGPVLVSKKKIYQDELHDALIAIPGVHTTARLLLSIIYPEARHVKEYLFSDIEEAVLSDETDAGVIIHENRFTYPQKGLRKVTDLGEEWEKITRLPLPLGGIIIRRGLPAEVKTAFDRLLSESVKYALGKPLVSLPYVKKHAQNLDESVIFQHINLFVNEFSVQMGEEGKKAITTLLEKGAKSGMLPPVQQSIFVSQTKNITP